MVFDSSDGIKRLGQFKNRLIVGIVIATIVAAAFIGFGLLKSAQYERQADINSGHYSGYTSKKISETCVAVSVIEKTKCVYEARDKEREYRYNQRDLVTQKRSALWAYIMAVAAVVGMALSALGVWLVKTTFDEAREANEIALKSHEQIIRPWLTIEIVNEPSMKIVDMRPEIKLKIRIENIGGTPAIDVRYTADFCIDYEPHIQMSANYSHERKDVFGREKDIFHSKFIEQELEIVHSGEPYKLATCFIVVTVFYKSVFSTDLKTTAAFFHVIDRRMEDGMVDLSSPLNSSNLLLLPWSDMPGVIE